MTAARRRSHRPKSAPHRPRAPRGSNGEREVERRVLESIAGVGLLALTAYVATLRYELVWDDALLLGTVEAASRTGGIGSVLTAPFELLGADEFHGYYRPVVLASLWADNAIGGGSAWVFHLTNVLLHVAVSILGLTLFRRFVSAGAALAAAVVFAAHPVHTESVAFVSGRTDVWAALFVLTSVLCWDRARTNGGERRAAWIVSGAAGCFLAILSKEVAFVLPAVLLAWDWLDRRQKTRRDVSRWPRGSLQWLLAWGIAVVAALAVRHLVAGVGLGLGSEGEPHAPNPAADPMAGVRLLATYLRLLVVPWPLFAYYSSEMVRTTAVTIVASVGLLGLIAVFATRERGRVGILALVWIVGFLVPVSGVVPLVGAALAERHLYLPSVGFCLLLGALLDRAAHWWQDAPRALRPAAGALLASAIVLLFGPTLLRSSVWQNDVRLYTHITRTAPMQTWAHYNLGLALQTRGQTESAEVAYRRTVELDPEFARAHYNLGHIDLRRQRPRDAVPHFRRAVEAEPGFSNGWNNLGVALTRSGRNQEALDAHRRAVDADPNNAAAHANLGLLYLRMGRRDLAIAERNILRSLDAEMAAELDRALQQ